MRGILIKHGYVQVRIQHKGVIHYKNFGINTQLNYKLAENYVKEIRRNLTLNVCLPHKEKAVSPTTFEEAAHVYIKLRGFTKQNAEYYVLLTNLIPYFGKESMASIYPARVMEWRKMRLKQVTRHGFPVRETSVNREQAVLSAMFNALERAVKTGELEPLNLPAENPCKYIQKTNEGLYKRTRVFSVDELHRLRLSCEELGYLKLWSLIKLAITTTLRRKDLLKAVAQEGSTANGTTKGIQAKTGRLYQLPIGISESGKEAGFGAIGISVSTLRRQWDAATKAAKIEDAQWRDLRRTGATLLEEAGYSTQLIKNVLGHATEAMTEKYLDLDVKKLAPLVNHLQTTLGNL